MVGARAFFVAATAIGLVVILSSMGGCGSSKNSDLGSQSENDDASAGSSGGNGSGGNSSGPTFGSGGADAAAPCTGGGLGCYVPANCTTTISGIVYDPAGSNPLYNVVVFIPNDPNGAMTPVKQGTNSCNTCDVSIGDYVTATTSGPDGSFTLTGVPATTHVPLVVQIGKWRREVFLPSVKACADNPLPGSSMTRLPAKRSEGDIPQMAIVTGGADNLGCFLKGIGLDASEYSAPGGGGRLDVYQGLPANQSVLGGLLQISGAPQLTGGGQGDCTTDNPKCVWNSKANLEKYDIVLLACEGDTFDLDDSDYQKEASMGQNGNAGGLPTNKSTAAKQALHDWLDEGGKVFSTHFQYTWFKNSPAAEFKGVATWLGTSNGSDTGLYDIETSIPKGSILSQWLGNVKALNGKQISLNGVAESVGTVNATAQRWIYNPQKDPQQGGTNDTKYLSILTPVGGIPVKSVDAGETNAQYCGKAVFSDLHTGGGPDGDIPGACKKQTLTPQLAALEFLFFDLSACVSSDSLPPAPPPPPTK
jgi:hypothetical protein